ncbi:hypothetical protein GCM10011381_29560 [Klenkia taihuensis]|nr:hypothetical protein GCM10011381_29560 [Klenkia taihuensis]
MLAGGLLAGVGLLLARVRVLLARVRVLLAGPALVRGHVLPGRGVRLTRRRTRVAVHVLPGRVAGALLLGHGGSSPRREGFSARSGTTIGSGAIPSLHVACEVSGRTGPG